MKALVLEEYGKLVYRDVETPDIRPDEVLVRVKAAAICGSDVHGMDGSTGRRIPPIVMGHEAAGVIERTGVLAGDFKAGERVTFDSTVCCGACYFCRRGEVNLCDERKVLGVSCAEYRYNGAFAEFVAVPARVLYRLPDGVDFVQAAMVEPLSIALHAMRLSGIGLGGSAMVVGAGMIGLLIIGLLKSAGCGTIIAVDKAPEKLAAALDFGATHTVDVSREQPPAAAAALTRGRGVDVAFEAVGVESTVIAAVQSVKKGGQVVLVGNLAPEVRLPLQYAVTRQIQLQGSCASSGDYPDCLDLIAAGKADVGRLISATAPLSEGAHWFGRLYAAEPGLLKVVLIP